jgi:hypothetical protein
MRVWWISRFCSSDISCRIYEGFLRRVGVRTGRDMSSTPIGMQSQTGYQDGLRSAKTTVTGREGKSKGLNSKIATSCTKFLHRFDRLFSAASFSYQEIRFSAPDDGEIKLPELLWPLLAQFPKGAYFWLLAPGRTSPVTTPYSSNQVLHTLGPFSPSRTRNFIRKRSTRPYPIISIYQSLKSSPRAPS